MFSTFQEPGFVANDTYDGDLTSSVRVVSQVNRTVLGTYTVTYSVTNAYGLAASAVRTVIVVDRVKPIVVLNGQTLVQVEAGDPYTDGGATATDNYDGNITSRIITTGLDVALNAVQNHRVSSNLVTYWVNDSSGNFASVSRNISIVDTTGWSSVFGL